MQGFAAEVIFIGVLTMIVGLVISYISMYVKSPEKTKQFEHWWSVAISFAITGMLIHIICEYSGINKYYCEHGVACRKL